MRLKATRIAARALVRPLMVIGGIRNGVVVDTEAAAVVTVHAAPVGRFIYKEQGGCEIRSLLCAFRKTSATISFLLSAAVPLSWLMAQGCVAVGVRGLVFAPASGPLVVVLMMNVLLLQVGKILEPLAAMILFVPTLLPHSAELQLDPTHFVILVVANLMIGVQTPPIVLLLFVTSAVGP